MNNGTVRIKEYVTLKDAAKRADVSFRKLRKKLREKGYLTSGYIAKKEYVDKEYFKNELKEYFRGPVKKQYEALLISGGGFSIISELADEIKAEELSKKTQKTESEKSCHAA